MRELKDKRQDASWERVVEKHVFHSVFPLASLKGEPGWERNRQEMFVCLFRVWYVMEAHTSPLLENLQKVLHWSTILQGVYPKWGM